MKRQQLVIIMVGGVALCLVIILVLRSASTYLSYNSLSRKMEHYDNSFNSQISKDTVLGMDGEAVTKMIFQKVSRSCLKNQVKLVQVHVPVAEEKDGFRISTQQVSLQGTFVPLMKCLNGLDDELGSVKITSLVFEKEVVDREALLRVQVFFQWLEETGKEI